MKIRQLRDILGMMNPDAEAFVAFFMPTVQAKRLT
jgi:hypothetical protein